MFTKEVMETFTELDFAVYDCIVKNKKQINKIPIKELASMAHVSTATVLRFCKKCGAGGYSEFKIMYKEYLEGRQEVLKDDKETELQSFITRIRSQDFQESLDKAHEYLAKSNCIIFIGIGTSGILGKYGARYFSNVGYFSLFIDDPWLPILQKPSEVRL